eukprot:scaffold2532_cov79-Skeletonema_menzelii.AAC.5
MGGLVIQSRDRDRGRRQQRISAQKTSSCVQRSGSAHVAVATYNTPVQKPKRHLFSKNKGKKEQNAEEGESEKEDYDDRTQAEDEAKSLHSERDLGAASVETDQESVEPTVKIDKYSTFTFGFNLNDAYQLGKTMFNTDAVVSTLFPVHGDQTAGGPTDVAEIEENGAEQQQEENAVKQEAKKDEIFAAVEEEVVKQEAKKEEIFAEVEEEVVEQEAKKGEFFAEVEEEAVKEEVKKEEPKKKRGLFGRKKRRQSEEKIHADEKRELDSTKRMTMPDARDEADEAAATDIDQKAKDKITNQEEDNKNNVDEEGSCCKEEEGVEWNDCAIFDQTHTAFSALARTFENRDWAAPQGNSNGKTTDLSKLESKQDGNSSFDKNPADLEPSPIIEQQGRNSLPENSHVINKMKSIFQLESNSLIESSLAGKIEPIFQLESNSLIENSLNEDATFQTKPVLEQDCNAIGKATETDELQIITKNTNMEGQEISGKFDRDENTVVSFLTQATGQTMWTRYFCPANFSDAKRESEIHEEDDNNVDKSDSFFGSVGGDADTVVSGLTLASGQTKWTRFFMPAESREMEPIYEDEDYEKSIMPYPGQGGGSVAGSASKPTSISSMKSCDNTTIVKLAQLMDDIEENSVSSSSARSNSSGSTAAKTASISQGAPGNKNTKTAPLRPMTAYVSPTVIRRKNRAEGTNVFQQKTNLPSSSHSVRSSGGSSKYFKAKLPSSGESISSMPAVPSSSHFVPSSGDASKSSKEARLLSSDASVASKPNVPSSLRSAKSFGRSHSVKSKSSKANLRSSGATVSSGSNQSLPQNAANAGTDNTRTAPIRPMTAYVSPTMIRRKNRAENTNVQSGLRSTQSFGGSSKYSKSKLPASDASIASKPNVPSSSSSVKSAAGASKSEEDSESSSSSRSNASSGRTSDRDTKISCSNEPTSDGSDTNGSDCSDSESAVETYASENVSMSEMSSVASYASKTSTRWWKGKR